MPILQTKVCLLVMIRPVQNKNSIMSSVALEERFIQPNKIIAIMSH